MSAVQTYRGVVRKGRIQLKPPVRLPEGSEVYVVVTGERVPSTTEPGDLYVSPERSVMEQERAAFQAMLPQLLTQFEGQYVALHQGQVVDHDADRAALVIRLDQTHPDAVVLVKRVTAEPERVLRMPSPRKVYTDGYCSITE
jgi:hypothetical protein